MSNAMRFKVGDQVILGAHDYNESRTYRLDWDQDMDRYVGKVATIKKQFQDVEVQAWYVDIDGGTYYWFEKNMRPVYDNPNQKCIECGFSAPHQNTNGAPYTCVFCMAEKAL